MNTRIPGALALLALICCGAWAAPVVPSANLLNNPGFESIQTGLPTDWVMADGCLLVNEAHSGTHALRVENPSGDWRLATQYVMVSGSQVQELEISGWLRLRDVKPGPADEDAAIVQVGFYDATGGETGDWETAGTWTGTADWEHFSEKITVPPATARIAVMFGLQNCTGVAWFDDFSLTATKYQGAPPVRISESRTDTRGWYPFTPEPDDYQTPTATDVSYLLDAPAGKHGFLTTHPDGHLYFQDGKRARFWGVVFVAPAPFCSHADADRIAARLAKYGVNMVRLHHLDADWSEPNIFDPGPNDTQHLSADSLDKLDYLIAQFKKHGIYVYLDFLVNRKFEPDDNVRDEDAIPSGAKIVAHYDPQILTLERLYMRQVMTHVNPYTGLRWADDPVIALMEVINEDSLFYEPWYDQVPPSYLEELRHLCRAINPAADPARMPFDAPTRRALYQIQTGYFLSMHAYLRSLGVKVPITGSNHWENMAPDLYSNSQMDYIDRHYYWDHPAEEAYGGRAPFENRPLLRNPTEDGLVPDLSVAKVAGKPLIVTEWCLCWPNEYMEEGPLIAAAYADFQDWDVMLRFDFTGTDWADKMAQNFDVGNKPSLMAQWPAAALLFYRPDLAAASQVVHTRLGEPDIFAGKPVGYQLPDAAPFETRIETVLGGQSSSPPLPASPMPPVMGPRALRWDQQHGLLTLDTDLTAAVTGFVANAGPIRLQHCTLTSSTPFADIWVSSLDGWPLTESAHILVTATARAENSGTVYNAGRSMLLDEGHAPLLLEPVQGLVRLDRAAGAPALHAYALSPTGRRLGPASLETGPDGLSLHLGAGPNFWYELAAD